MKLYKYGLPACRCDGCGKLETSVDDFDGFTLSWPMGFAHGTSALILPKQGIGETLADTVERTSQYAPSGEPLIKFIHDGKNKKTPAMLHVCEDCAQKVKRALKRKKPEQMPDGPLKQQVRDILANPENRYGAFIITFYKESKIAGT